MATRVVMVPGWEERVDQASMPTIWHITEEVEDDAKRYANVDTGEMKASIRHRKLRRSGQVWIGTDHWHFIEYGTRPHVITPNKKEALWWEGAAHPVKRVNHPGTRAYRPMRRALYQRRTVRRTPNG